MCVQDDAAFDAAVKGGDAATVERLGTARRVAKVDGNRNTPLHFASWHGHANVATVLLGMGAAPDAREGDDWTPLHYACANGHRDVAEVLLAAGAPLDAKNRFGRTPIDSARNHNHPELAEWLSTQAAGALAHRAAAWPRAAHASRPAARARARAAAHACMHARTHAGVLAAGACFVAGRVCSV